MFNFDSKEELAAWINQNVVSTAEAIEILGGTRQNLHGFVKNGKLVPIKETNRERLFWRSDVEERLEESKRYNRTDKKG